MKPGKHRKIRGYQFIPYRLDYLEANHIKVTSDSDGANLNNSDMQVYSLTLSTCLILSVYYKESHLTFTFLP